MKPVVLVPAYNHPDTIGQLVNEIVARDYSCLIINDGSTDGTGDVAEELATQHDQVAVIHRSNNGGKGRAVFDGLQWAENNGYTHAVTIDADRQHDPDTISKFLDVARSAPDSLVLGDPVFDETIPSSRKYGRILSQVWVWIETLSLRIHDPLCGFRCYPVKRTLAVMERETVGTRMDFEPEIAVRFYWNGGDVRNVSTKVRYFPDGTSHFDMVGDNLRISWMHFRLFFGSFLRYPWLVARWFSHDE